MNNILKESTVYDNFVGKEAVEQLPGSLDEFIGTEKKIDLDLLTKKKEAPKYFKKIRCHFNSYSDMMEFSALIGHSITEKTTVMEYKGTSPLEQFFKE